MLLNLSDELDLVDLAAPPVETTPADDTDESDSPHSTGIIPCQDLRELIATRQIVGLEPIEPSQIQPASLDLRLGGKAFRVRASFLPGRHGSVQRKLEALQMHEMDITNGGVLERGCVYIIPLLETLDLRHRVSALGNPKSSTGRLDVFTRLITDQGTSFDQVREQYTGQLYAEVSPRTFSVLVRKGTRLSQLRIRRGRHSTSDKRMRQLQQEHKLIEPPPGHEIHPSDIENGVPVRVDLAGTTSGGVIGYKARSHAGLIDMDRVDYYEVEDFWEPVHAPKGGGLILDPAEFYILASQDNVKVPPGYAAEMIAYDTLVGEFRVHYAGFFDPGFGHAEAGGEGAKAVLEVRSYEVPFVIEHGQVVGKLVYERLTAVPNVLYGQAARSSYQGQGIKLSKHFKLPRA